LEDYFENRENFYLCLEIQSSQTLFDFINKFKDEIDELKARDLALKIGLALESLHDNGIILKNLESSGILMT
jgi:serine/threonine protein kinase